MIFGIFQCQGVPSGKKLKTEVLGPKKVSLSPDLEEPIQ